MSDTLKEVFLNLIQSIAKDYTVQLYIAGAVVFTVVVLLIIRFRNNDIAMEDDIPEPEEEGNIVENYDFEKPSHMAGILGVGGITVAVVAVLVVYPIIGSYVEAREEYVDISYAYTTPVEVNVDEYSSEEIAVNVIPSWYKIDVDFDSLKEANPEAVGWITVDGIDVIDYPIVQADDNDKYLHETFNGTASSSGAIFLSSDNSSNFTDGYSIIYGHNMRDGSMFGQLKRFINEPDFITDTGGYFTVYTPACAYRYLIFSVCTLDANDEIYTQAYKNGTDEFTGLLERMISLSQFASDVIPNENSRIITLSTCSYSDTVRLTVQGMLMERYPQ